MKQKITEELRKYMSMTSSDYVADRILALLPEHGQGWRLASEAIKAKCEQYWNEHAPGDAEFRAILTQIHQYASGTLAPPLSPAPPPPGEGNGEKTVRDANDSEDAIACGPITHDEAREIATRFFHSHFDNGGEKARISIPANPKRDDDIRLVAYIKQQRDKDAEIARLTGEVERLQETIRKLPTPPAVKDPRLSNPKCSRCGDTPSCGDGAWRFNGERWEHRCRDTDPQAGYFEVDGQPLPQARDRNVTVAELLRIFEGHNSPLANRAREVLGR